MPFHSVCNANIYILTHPLACFKRINKIPLYIPYDIVVQNTHMSSAQQKVWLLRLAFNVYVNTTWTLSIRLHTRSDVRPRGLKIYFNAKTREYEVTEKLLVNKIGGIFGGGFAAFLPIMLGDDLTRLECALRGKDVLEYKSCSIPHPHHHHHASLLKICQIMSNMKYMQNMTSLMFMKYVHYALYASLKIRKICKIICRTICM